MNKTTKFDYGDSVLLEQPGDTGRSVSEPCAVVGISLVDNEYLAHHVSHPIGTGLYTVEFGDGSDALVPESALKLDTDEPG